MSPTETEDLAKLAAGGRMLKNGRIRRALIARLLSERAEGTDEEGEEDTSDESDEGDDRQLVRALVGSRLLRRRRLRRLLLAKLIRDRHAEDADADVDDDDEDTDEDEGGDDRQLARLIIGSRMLRRRRIRRLLIARLIKARSEADEDYEDDDLEDDDDDIGEEGSDRDRKFMRLLVASRVLRRRRVRRALIAKLLKNRSESEGEFGDVDEDDGDDESPDVERQLARLLVGGRVVRRRRTRRAALVRFLRNRD